MKWLTLAAALASAAGCEPMQTTFAPAPGEPASLRLAPVEFYSRSPARMGPRPSQDSGPTKPKPDAPLPPPQATPEPPTLPEAVDELERLNERLQELRRRINKPRSIEPPT